MFRGAVRTEGALLRDLDEIFETYDKSRSGCISPHSYRLAHMEAFGAPPSDREVTLHHRVTRDEFIATMRRKAPLWDAEDQTRVIFSAFDVARKGYITQVDFAAACEAVAPHLSKATVEDAFKALDEFSDGRVRFNMFKSRLFIE